MKRALLVSLLAPCAASAAGFAVGDQGAAAMGQGSAVTASRGDPSAAWYNPASLAGEEGFGASANLTVVAPFLSAADPAGGPATSAVVQPATPPAVFGSWGAGDLAASLAAGVPFGATLEWPAGWRGRYEVTGIALQDFALAPSVAYRVQERLRLAVGLTVHLGTVKLDKDLDFVDATGHVVLGGSGQGLGVAAAALYDFGDHWRAGLSWRSRATVEFDGRAHFTGVPLAFEDKAHDQAVKTRLTLPDLASLGGEWRSGPWRAGVDLDYTQWSTLRSFDIDFADPATPDVHQPRNWHGAVAVRAGGAWRSGQRPLTLRAGAFFDQMPSPADTLSPTLPDSNRVGLALGGGWRFSRVAVDASYQLVVLTGSQSTGSEAFPARYGGTAHLFAVSVSWHQEPPPPDVTLPDLADARDQAARRRRTAASAPSSARAEREP